MPTLPRALIATLVLTAMASASAVAVPQVADGDTPQFDAVSVKPCDPNAGATGVRGGGPPSPQRLFVPCMPVRTLIRLAYFPGQNVRDQGRLAGGSEWLDSERYTIEAVAADGVPRATISGPMFQALLVARFGLRVRRELRAVRAYALTVAPQGIRFGALRDGDCVQGQTPHPQRPRKPDCDLMKRAGSEPPVTLSRLLERGGQAWVETRGTNRIYHAVPTTIDAFALFLDSILDRPVTNGTRLTGLFDIRLEFSSDGTLPPADPAVLLADPPSAPSIFTALQEQLGLRLESAQTPTEFVLIESIARPKPN